MQIVLLYNEEQGETEEQVRELEWFIKLAFKDWDGTFEHPEVADAEIILMNLPYSPVKFDD